MKQRSFNQRQAAWYYSLRHRDDLVGKATQVQPLEGDFVDLIRALYAFTAKHKIGDVMQHSALHLKDTARVGLAAGNICTHCNRKTKSPLQEIVRNFFPSMLMAPKSTGENECEPETLGADMPKLLDVIAKSKRSEANQLLEVFMHATGPDEHLALIAAENACEEADRAEQTASATASTSTDMRDSLAAQTHPLVSPGEAGKPKLKVKVVSKKEGLRGGTGDLKVASGESGKTKLKVKVVGKGGGVGGGTGCFSSSALLVTTDAGDTGGLKVASGKAEQNELKVEVVGKGGGVRG